MKEFQGKNIRLVSLDRGVKKIIFSRPEIKNAFHEEMIDEIIFVLENLHKIENALELRLLILEGEGSAFCAGADLNYMKKQSHNNETENKKDAMRLAHMFYLMASFPTTVLSLVQGAAIGGGLGIVCCSDIVYVKNKSVFATTEVLLGIIPAVISPYILRKINVSNASEFMLTGKKFDEETAIKYGLVQQIFIGDDFVVQQQIEKEIENHLKAGPEAVRATKNLILKSSPLPSLNIIQWTSEQIAKTRVNAEGQEGLQCYFTKQNPSWDVSANS